MSKEQLKKTVRNYINDNNVCVLATRTGDYVRCTPLEYSYHDDKFWIFSEGGAKFIGLVKNENVCLAVFDGYDRFHNLKSVQVMGKAEIIALFSKCYNVHAKYKKLPLFALEQFAATVNLICVTPTKIEALFSYFKKDGYDARQILD